MYSYSNIIGMSYMLWSEMIFKFYSNALNVGVVHFNYINYTYKKEGN